MLFYLHEIHRRDRNALHTNQGAAACRAVANGDLAKREGEPDSRRASGMHRDACVISFFFLLLFSRFVAQALNDRRCTCSIVVVWIWVSWNSRKRHGSVERSDSIRWAGFSLWEWDTDAQVSLRRISKIREKKKTKNKIRKY